MTNFYVRKNNSSYFVRKSNNTYYVNTNSAGSITSGLVLSLDAANSASYPGTGTVWYDLASPANNLTLSRNDMYSASYGGGSMHIQGSYADAIEESYNDYLDFGTDSFSIELWTMITNTSTPAYQDILNIGKYNNGVLLRYINQPMVGSDSLYIAGSYYDWNPQINLPQDTWKHLVVVKAGTNVKMYVNATEVINDTAPETVHPDFGVLIGHPAHQLNGEAYDGYLSVLKIYRTYALTASDVTQNFNATKSRYGL